MRYIKMLGLAVVASAALVALIGAGTASATAFCQVEGSGGLCPGEAYSAGQEIDAALSSGTKVKLKTEVATVECSESTIKGETSSEEGTPLSGPVSTLSFGSCNCEVKVLKTGTISTEWIAGTNNGTPRLTGSEITTSCSTVFGNVHCLYKTENTDLGALTGGSPATLDLNTEIPRLATSFLCSEKAHWEGNYEFTAPKPLYVTGGPSWRTDPPNGASLLFTQANPVQKVYIENLSKDTITVGPEQIDNADLFDWVKNKFCSNKAIASGFTCTVEIRCLAKGQSKLTIPVFNLGKSVIKLNCQ
jgi:hypothetical protein